MLYRQTDDGISNYDPSIVGRGNSISSVNSLNSVNSGNGVDQHLGPGVVDGNGLGGMTRNDPGLFGSPHLTYLNGDHQDIQGGLGSSYEQNTSPVDGTDGTGSDKFRRNYRACLNCRVRKVKCDLGPVDSPRDGKCARCLRERKDCVFVDSKRGGSGHVANKKRPLIEIGPETSAKKPKVVLENHSKSFGSLANSSSAPVQPEPLPHSTLAPSLTKLLNSLSDSTHGFPSEVVSSHNAPNPSNHFSTMEGALVFLAKAAGTIARADERDHIDARLKHEAIENSEKTHIDSVLNKTIPEYLKPPAPNSRMAMPPIEKGYVVRPKATTKLLSIDYIGGPDGIISEAEAEQLIHHFFATMHPFFPHIPKFLHLPKVLLGYPILLCSILTIASRYHIVDSNTGNGGIPRSIEVHDRLWLYVQRLISQTVWAEASTRSIGTIFSFLLFTEWNPRAIHWRWSDYANKPEEQGLGGADGPVSDDIHFAGLGAMRRSYRMAWMLIGSAVRLAQDMGFMEISSKTFLATHIAEINSVMNISRRSMLSHSLSEVDLDQDEIAEEELGDEANEDDKIMKMTEEELKALSSEHVLKFTLSQKAQIELLQIMSLGHESLYGYKAQLGHLSQRQNLSILNIVSPLINNWRRKFKLLLIPTNAKFYRTNNQASNLNSKVFKEISECIEHESLIFEFNYVKLYIYSLALSPSQKPDRKRKTLKLDEISKSSKYIEQAFQAANEMLLVAHRVHRLKMLRYMPVRWLTRMVRAVAFIVKCYLTITAHKKSSKSSDPSQLIDDFDSAILSLSLITIDEIVQSIQRAAITLRDCSPDELHLCTRYSNVLMYLCSEMKTKSKSDENAEHAEHEQEPTYEEPELATETEPELTEPSYYHHQQLPLPVNLEYVDSTPEDAPLVGESEVMEWFASNKDIGLDFVGPWTEMIEQQLNLNELQM